MKPKIVLLFLCTTIVVSVQHVHDVHACTCSLQAPLKQLTLSDAVFAGKVAAIDVLPDNTRRAQLVVTEEWKGTASTHYWVDTTPTDACPFTLNLGQTYLIYAMEGTGQVSRYLTHECMRTRLRSQAQYDVDMLESLQLLPVQTSTWGRIKALYDPAR